MTKKQKQTRWKWIRPTIEAHALGSKAALGSSTETMQAKLQIVFPVVKIRFEELAALKLVEENEKGTLEERKCVPAYRTRNKLIALGLVKEIETDPLPSELKAFKQLEQDTWETLLKLLNRCPIDWDVVDQVPLYKLCESNRPGKRKADVLTCAGKDLLAKGTAMTTVNKAGCK